MQGGPLQRPSSNGGPPPSFVGSERSGRTVRKGIGPECLPHVDYFSIIPLVLSPLYLCYSLVPARSFANNFWLSFHSLSVLLILFCSTSLHSGRNARGVTFFLLADSPNTPRRLPLCIPLFISGFFKPFPSAIEKGFGNETPPHFPSAIPSNAITKVALSLFLLLMEPSPPFPL